MDNAESVLIECAVLTVEVCLSCLMYKLYKEEANLLKSLKEAQCFELDSELQKNVEKNNGVIQYGVISGSIKALSAPLRSQFNPYMKGVIREKVTKEHKVKWSHFLRIWSSTKHEVQHTINSIPFAICSKTSGLFKKQVCVDVLEPLVAEELKLPTIYDEFVPYQGTLGDALYGFFLGERTVGLQEVENMLCEDVIVTAVGKLVLENNKLKIMPPDKGLTYFLTPLTLDSLMRDIGTAAKVFKVLSYIMGIITLTTVMYMSKRAFSELKRKITRNREKKRLEEQRRLRRIADNSRNEQAANIPKCVVCLEYPVEILILECGHACLCYNCSEQIKNLCPVCRNPINRTVPTFWP